MNIYFRADSSINMGTGHIMRCLTLATALQEEKCKITFICRELPDVLHTMLKQKGINVIKLCSNMDEEHVEVLNIIAKNQYMIDWLIVDHYSIDTKWESQVKPYVKRLFVIDDLANRSHNCDLILDQNLYEDFQKRYSKLVPKGCIQLLGPKFALLRKEFTQRREKFLEKSDHDIKRILICFGGTDPSNETLKCVNAIKDSVFSKLHFDVVIGSTHSKLAELNRIIEDIPNVNLYIQTTDMATLMAEADLGICSGGTITWERYCMGLPAIIIAVAENQINIAKNAERILVDRYLGYSENIAVGHIREALLNSLKQVELLRISRIRAMELVDGQGASRIVDHMIKLSSS